MYNQNSLVYDGGEVGEAVVLSTNNRSLENMTMISENSITIETNRDYAKTNEGPKIHGWVPICSYLLCHLPFIDCS